MAKYWAEIDGGLAFFDEAVHGAVKVEATLTEAEKARGKRPKLVANPDCRIPAAAKLISDEEHARLMELQNGTHELRVENGKIVAVDLADDPAQILAANTKKRNRLLAESDWRILPDSPLSQSERRLWSFYRQQLRDMDLQAGNFPVTAWEAGDFE